MRQNLPVTDLENAVRDSDVLISRTDPKGRITYVSEDFCRISEFSRDEMIGRPHNLIRHPDVPPAIFADLWSTIQAGKPWNGIVKNRARSGNYYWVEANVTPLVRAGSIVGYLSVRRRPTEKQKQDAIAYYRRVANADRIATGWPGRLREWNRSLPVRVAGIVALLLLPLVEAVLVATRSGNWDPVVLPFGTAAVSCLLAFLLLRGILSAAGAAAETARIVSIGDLSRTRAPESSVAELAQVQSVLRSMTIALWGIVTQVRDTAEKSRTTAEAVSATADRLSESAQQQAAANEESAAAIEQATASLDGIAASIEGQTSDIVAMRRGTQSLKSEAERVSATAREAGSLSEKLNAEATRCRDSISVAIQSVEEIRGVSRQIAQAMAVISDISEKINLLSLNASIESARAGEAGRGFAVVAEHVSRLADLTAGSVREVSELIADAERSVDLGTERIRSVMTLFGGVIEGVHSLAQAQALAGRAMQTQLDLAASVDTSAAGTERRAREVTAATREQRLAVSEIAQTTQNLAEQAQIVAEEAAGLLRLARGASENTAQALELLDFFTLATPGERSAHGQQSEAVSAAAASGGSL